MAEPGTESLERRKVILDVDTGIDDAHAIMLALSRADIDVVAITCSNGNVKIDDVTSNTLRVLHACDRLEVPVYKGAARSLLGQVSKFDNFTGPAWTTPVDLKMVQSEQAANALVRLAREHPGKITLVALAPLTNIAMAVNLDPGFPSNLCDVFIMGGNTAENFNVVIFSESTNSRGTKLGMLID
nr:hypothetical protein BaRGS_033436 [Batillaria attramentaria]